MPTHEDGAPGAGAHSDDLPAAHVHDPAVKTGQSWRLSPVWFVPLIAALIGGLVAWQSYADRGPLVEISFEKGHGIAAGKTEIKHKDVVVGIVEEVTLTEDLQNVLVKARMDNVVEPYLGPETDFWIVSANISGTNLSGLGTLLSGAYIEVGWPGRAEERERQFKGLDVQPLTPPGTEGRQVNLRTDTAGSISVGSPVFYKRIRVGQVESRELADDFSHVKYKAFINAPYDKLLSPATHFWNVSGIQVKAGTSGLEVQLASMEALFAGGISFSNLDIVPASDTFDQSTVFPVYASKTDAEESRFDDGGEDAILFMVTFEDSVEGLSVGAPVEWQGIRLGTVRDIVLDLNDERRAAGRAVYVLLALQPSRIGLQGANQEMLEAMIIQWVDQGMRVQLATGNLLTGTKLIKLVNDAGTDDAQADFSSKPYPSLPTAPSELGAMTQNVEQIIANVAELPLDELMRSAINLLNSTDTVMDNPDLDRLLASFADAANDLSAASKDLPTLIANLNRITDAGEATLSGLSPDSEVYQDLSGALRNLRDASRSLAALASHLEQNPNALLTGR